MSEDPLPAMFAAFKEEIDGHYDRRERVIKASRDVTALSKKMIFSLLRTPILDAQDSTIQVIPATILQEVSKYETQIKGLLSKVSADLQQANALRYQRNISGGMQEYIEAIALRFYLEHERIPSWQETQHLVAHVEVTHVDYILSIADVTGELTRRAIAALALPESEALVYTRNIATCLRELTTQFQLLEAAGNHAEGLRDLSKKLQVMESSLRKVELGICDKCIRGSERPAGWVASEDGRAET